MDKMEKAEIKILVKTTIRETLEGSKEVWLKEDDFIAHFQMFTKSWLKTYGERLPRTPAIVTDANGCEHKTGYAYPMHKINRMIEDGTIKNL